MSTQPAGFALAPGRRRALRLQLHSTHPTPVHRWSLPSSTRPGRVRGGTPNGRGPREVRPPRWLLPGGVRTERDPGPPAARPRSRPRGVWGRWRREEGAGGAPRRPERSRGNAPPRGGAAATGPFVGGAAGSHSGHGPRSPCTWPAQPPRQTRAWNTPFPHALENSCAVLLHLTLRGVAAEDLN